MTKQDVIERIYQRTGQDPLTSRSVLEAFFGIVKQELSVGQSIYVRGFGSFVPVQRGAKVGRNINRLFGPGNSSRKQVTARQINALSPMFTVIETSPR